jgi:hypothetical protein
VEETTTDRSDVIEVDMVSISSGERSNLVEVAQPSRAEGPMALARVGRSVAHLVRSKSAGGTTCFRVG